MNPRPDSPLARPWAFFALALGWSWLSWAPLVLGWIHLASAAGLVSAGLGLFGPFVAGVTATYRTRDAAGRRDYWTRVIDPSRIGIRWFAVILLLVPVIFALSVLFDVAAGGTGNGWEENAVRIAAHPTAFFGIALGIFFVGPMEEFGWRGYVLDRLQETRTPLVSSLILGVVWSAWHLPLFFIPGTYQQALGVGSQSFWLFLIGIVPLTVVFTWIYNSTNRSTLAIMVFHFMVNFTGELVLFSPRAEFISIGLWFVAAAVVSRSIGPGPAAPS